MFFLMYLLLAVLAQKGLELRSEEGIIAQFVTVHGSWGSAGLGMVTLLVQVMCSAHQMFCHNSGSNQPEQIIW